MTEVWDKKKCERISKRIATDGYGTPYPFPGYLQGYSWETELPEVHEDYEIVHEQYWGLRLKKKDK